jgi:16S rRNA (cytosine967-C5)-methyltransferase
MKIHKVLIDAIVTGLKDIFYEGKYADKVVESTLKSNKKWGSRDRAFIAENIYDCVRWWKLLWYIIEKEPKNNTEDIRKLVGVQLCRNYNQVRVDKCKDKSVLLSYPEWMLKLSKDKNWIAQLESMNNQGKLVLRTNTLNCTVKDIEKELTKEKIFYSKTKLNAQAIVIENKYNLFATDMYRNGLVEVQDAGSQLIAPYLQVEAGMRVVDACAGGGGKALHMATLMNNKGSIIALDTEEWKLENLKKRAKRNKVHIIETRAISSTKIIKRLYDTADRLLLDVPCSGIGVLKRNPDAKWKITPEMIDNVNITQKMILEKYAPIVKIGGKIVYATCSLLPKENEEVVHDFLSKSENYQLISQQHITPLEHGFDGFYMALIERVG